MRELDYPAPNVSRIPNVDGAIACALFTFRYISERPAFDTAFRVAMEWRIHTHFACHTELKECVITALLLEANLSEVAARHSQHAAARDVWSCRVHAGYRSVS